MTSENKQPASSCWKRPMSRYSINSMLRGRPSRKKDCMKENEYSIIMAFVDQGFSEELMSAARSAESRQSPDYESHQ